MSFISTNFFSYLHNNHDIFFFHRNFVNEALNLIKTKNNNCVLITGNSDYIIDEQFIDKLPSNLVSWYGQNVLVRNDIIIPYPLGLKNTIKPLLQHQHTLIESNNMCDQQTLSDFSTKQKKPNQLIYANFNVETNLNVRLPCQNICKDLKFITLENSSCLPYRDFCAKIQKHKAVVCPDGNGPDTHRIYEVLYLGRIPITCNKQMYDLLWYNFPIVNLDSFEQLSDEEFILNEIKKIEKRQFNKQMLDVNFWIESIKSKT